MEKWEGMEEWGGRREGLRGEDKFKGRQEEDEVRYGW